LIRQTVWPQYTNVTDRQTDREGRQRSDSIGLTVLQTVAQKPSGRTAFLYFKCSRWFFLLYYRIIYARTSALKWGGLSAGFISGGSILPIPGSDAYGDRVI